MKQILKDRLNEEVETNKRRIKEIIEQKDNQKKINTNQRAKP